MTDRALVLHDIPEGARIQSCMGCGGPIVWIVTKNGKRMPVEPLDKSVNGNKVTRGESHFAHCPHAARFRRPK